MFVDDPEFLALKERMCAGDVDAPGEFAQAYGTLILATMRDGPRRLGRVCIWESRPVMREVFEVAGERGSFKGVRSDAEFWCLLIQCVLRGTVVRSRETGERVQ